MAQGSFLKIIFQRLLKEFPSGIASKDTFEDCFGLLCEIVLGISQWVLRKEGNDTLKSSENASQGALKDSFEFVYVICLKFILEDLFWDYLKVCSRLEIPQEISAVVAL